MTRDDPHFRLRVPESLKRQIEISARANSRSLTAEIVHRLEETFGQKHTGSAGVVDEIEDIRSRLEHVLHLIKSEKLDNK
jgi:hypothetical protein